MKFIALLVRVKVEVGVLYSKIDGDKKQTFDFHGKRDPRGRWAEKSVVKSMKLAKL